MKAGRTIPLARARQLDASPRASRRRAAQAAPADAGSQKVMWIDVSPTVCKTSLGHQKRVLSIAHTFRPSKLSYTLSEVATSISRARVLPCTTPCNQLVRWSIPQKIDRAAQRCRKKAATSAGSGVPGSAHAHQPGAVCCEADSAVPAALLDKNAARGAPRVPGSPHQRQCPTSAPRCCARYAARALRES